MVQTERTVNPVIRQTANIITLSRLAAAGVLLFLTPFTPEFYAAYLWCGVSDMIDGTIARKTHSESRLGEKLEERYPDFDVEVNEGGQPIYYYVVSVE